MANLAVFNSAAFLTVSQLAVAGGATIEVRREDTGALAAIYSDEAGAALIANPSAFADSSGRFTFYAAGIARGYSILVTSGAESFTLRNVAIGTLAQQDASNLVLASSPTGTPSTTTTSLLSALGNSAVVATEYAFQQGAGQSTTDMVSGANIIPSGSVVNQANGIAGYVKNFSTTTNAVAGYFQAYAAATGAKVWALNPLVDDNTFDATVIGIELDVGCKNTNSTIRGLAVTGVFGSLNPADSVGVEVTKFNAGKWDVAYLTQDGATDIAFYIGAKDTTANSDGQVIGLSAYDAGGVLREATIQAAFVTAGANLNISTPTGVTFFTNGVQFGGQITATAVASAAAANQVNYGSRTQTTIGANGAASALTANPLGYIKIFVAGVSALIPYYNS